MNNKIDKSILRSKISFSILLLILFGAGVVFMIPSKKRFKHYIHNCIENRLIGKESLKGNQFDNSCGRIIHYKRKDKDCHLLYDSTSIILFGEDTECSKQNFLNPEVQFSFSMKKIRRYYKDINEVYFKLITESFLIHTGLHTPKTDTIEDAFVYINDYVDTLNLVSQMQHGKDQGFHRIIDHGRIQKYLLKRNPEILTIRYKVAKGVNWDIDRITIEIYSEEKEYTFNPLGAIIFGALISILTSLIVSIAFDLFRFYHNT